MWAGVCVRQLLTGQEHTLNSWVLSSAYGNVKSATFFSFFHYFSTFQYVFIASCVPDSVQDTRDTKEMDILINQLREEKSSLLVFFFFFPRTTATKEAAKATSCYYSAPKVGQSLPRAGVA